MSGPTNLEQELLELVNEARLNPLANASRYISSYSPLTSNNSGIANALNFFGVNGPALQAAYTALVSVQPLAWNENLATAARGHSNAMIAQDSQSHQLPGELGLGDRISAAGYTGWNALGENIFAYATSPLYAHAGFMVDWGAGPNGMQDPPGHRNNIMSSTFREIGIGTILDNNSGNSVGPQVVTQDFGFRSGSGAFVLGVAYNDTNSDGIYTAGEGLGTLGVVLGGTNITNWASGGYTIETFLTGSQTVTFTGAGLSSAVSVTITLSSSSNIKLDIVNGNILRTSASVSVAGPITTIIGLGVNGLSLAATGSGNQLIYGTLGSDTLNGGLGGDNLYGGDGADSHIGGDDAGIDYARYDDANYGNLTIRLDAPGANAGSAAIGDTYTGIEGLVGGLGNDTVVGNASNNFLFGGGGGDFIYGLGGNDYLNGGAGGDQLYGGAGADSHIGGDDAGIDYARYDDANYGNLTIRLDAPGANAGSAAIGDTYTGIEGLVGGLGNDTVVGNASNNFLFGGGGGDFIYGLGGNDYLNGGAGGDSLYGGAGADQHIGGDDAGIDYARYDDANYGNLTIRLDAPGANAGSAAIGDTYTGIEGLVGGAGVDVVVGNALANYLFGGGNTDYLYGASGNDYLNGGAGADRFVFNFALNASTNVDTIADFVVGVDDIQLSTSIFSAVGATLTADEFRIGSALDANDFILYNNATGRLFYDADGNGATFSAIQFATVTAGIALTAGDFLIA